MREIYDRRMFPLYGPWRVRECPNLHGWNQYGLRLRHRHVRLFRLKEASQRQPHHLRNVSVFIFVLKKHRNVSLIIYVFRNSRSVHGICVLSCFIPLMRSVTFWQVDLDFTNLHLDTKVLKPFLFLTPAVEDLSQCCFVRLVASVPFFAQ